MWPTGVCREVLGTPEGMRALVDLVVVCEPIGVSRELSRLSLAAVRVISGIIGLDEEDRARMPEHVQAAASLAKVRIIGLVALTAADPRNATSCYRMPA